MLALPPQAARDAAMATLSNRAMSFFIVSSSFNNMAAMGYASLHAALYTSWRFLFAAFIIAKIAHRFNWLFYWYFTQIFVQFAQL